MELKEHGLYRLQTTLMFENALYKSLLLFCHSSHFSSLYQPVIKWFQLKVDNKDL
jgi:hypothetical protein